jgi:hypothetical protein
MEEMGMQKETDRRQCTCGWVPKREAHRGTTEWNILLVWKCLQVTRNNLVVVIGEIQRLEITVLLTPASEQVPDW